MRLLVNTERVGYLHCILYCMLLVYYNAIPEASKNDPHRYNNIYNVIHRMSVNNSVVIVAELLRLFFIRLNK